MILPFTHLYIFHSALTILES